MESILGRRAFYIQNTVAAHYVVLDTISDPKKCWTCSCDRTKHYEARTSVEHHITVQIIHALNVLNGKPSAPNALREAWGMPEEMV